MGSSADNATIRTTVSDALGSEINDIAGVGFTHLHIDHTQGLENFCIARGVGALLFQSSSHQ
jgi:phosphoribosyl 1,2-cyclic phosphodiesterase